MQFCDNRHFWYIKILTRLLGFRFWLKKIASLWSFPVFKYPDETQNKSLEDMLQFGYICIMRYFCLCLAHSMSCLLSDLVVAFAWQRGGEWIWFEQFTSSLARCHSKPGHRADNWKIVYSYIESTTEYFSILMWPVSCKRNLPVNVLVSK